MRRSRFDGLLQERRCNARFACWSAKPGLDGHDRGAKVVAAALRDSGMEVIYTGLHQTPEQIVEAALQEDVDVVALSILSGAHMTLFPETLELMRGRGIGDKLLTGGGIISPEDTTTLPGWVWAGCSGRAPRPWTSRTTSASGSPSASAPMR